MGRFGGDYPTLLDGPSATGLRESESRRPMTNGLRSQSCHHPHSSLGNTRC